jgi:hypothetical protein
VIAEAVFLPAALHFEFGKLSFSPGMFVSKNGQADERISLQLSGNVKPVFIQYRFAGGKTTHKTNFHLGPESKK